MLVFGALTKVMMKWRGGDPYKYRPRAHKVCTYDKSGGDFLLLYYLRISRTRSIESKR